jgi:hypothetical protein
MMIKLSDAQVRTAAAFGRNLPADVLGELALRLPADTLGNIVRGLGDDMLATLALERVLGQMTAQIGPTSDEPSDGGIKAEAGNDDSVPIRTPDCIMTEQQPDSTKPPIQRLVQVERRKAGRPVKYKPDATLEDQIVDYAASHRGCTRKEIALAIGVPLNYSFDKAMVRVLQDGRLEKRGERGLTSYHAEKRAA